MIQSLAAAMTSDDFFDINDAARLANDKAAAEMRAAFGSLDASRLKKLAQELLDFVENLGFAWVEAAIDQNWPEGLSIILTGLGREALDANKETALMRATRARRVECQKAAWPFCDAKRTNNAGKTALMIALEDEAGDSWKFRDKHHASVELLIPVSDVNQIDPEGRDALAIAGYYNARIANALAPFVKNPEAALRALIEWHFNGDGHDSPHNWPLIDELGHRCEMTPHRVEWFVDFVSKFAAADFMHALPKTFAVIEARDLRATLVAGSANIAQSDAALPSARSNARRM